MKCPQKLLFSFVKRERQTDGWTDGRHYDDNTLRQNLPRGNKMGCVVKSKISLISTSIFFKNLKLSSKYICRNHGVKALRLMFCLIGCVRLEWHFTLPQGGAPHATLLQVLYALKTFVCKQVYVIHYVTHITSLILLRYVITAKAITKHSEDHYK